MKTVMKLALALAALFWLSALWGAAALEAQDKGDPLSPTALVRENETLRREILGLKATIRDREARLQLALQNLEVAYKALSADPASDKAAQDRCAGLEQRLRDLEDPPKGAVFDCRTLGFSDAKGKP